MKTKVALGEAAVVLLAVGSYVAIRAVLPQGGTSFGTAATAVAAGPAAEVDRYVELAGTVRGPDGASVVGALVSQGDSPFDVDNVATHTDVDGNFYLSVKVGRPLELSVQKSGYTLELTTAPAILGEQPKYSFTLKLAGRRGFGLVDQRGMHGAESDSLTRHHGGRRRCCMFMASRGSNGWQPLTDADGVVCHGRMPLTMP